MSESYPKGDALERGLGCRRPLHEGDRIVGQIVVQESGLLALESLEPVEVEVRHRKPARVAMADREGGRRHRLGYAERTARAADQGSLGGAELTADEHHVSGLKLGRQPRADLLGLRRA